MDYSKFLNEIETASLFDLYRIHVAIGNVLDQLAHLNKIKTQLIIGMTIQYFHASENRLISATILELRSKKVVVLDHKSKKRLLIPYYMINLNNVDTAIHVDNKKLDVNSLKVGDMVSFIHQGKDIFGQIKRLNQKSVSMVTADGHQWRVGYGLLSLVHEGELIGPKQLSQSDVE